jgi:hypothetical protein
MLGRRSVRHVGVRLGLLAIWLQLVLTLGHIHPSDIYLYGHPVAHGAGLQEVLAGRPTIPVPLAPLRQNAATDLACSLCANMALAASVVLPDPIKLPLPSALPSHSLGIGDAFAPTPAKFLLFQTRAPPLV